MLFSLNELKKRAEDRWCVIDKCRNKKVLALGCVNHSIKGVRVQQAKGIFLLDYFKKYANRVVGLDLDKRGIGYLLDKGYDIRFGDAQNFNLNEQFDVIVASKLIDHLLNIDDFLCSCKKHLGKKGVIIISDDNILSLPRLLLWYFKRSLGRPDNDITLKPIPFYFKNFIGRYNLTIKEEGFHFTIGTPSFFKLLVKFIPNFLIYPPLFYPSYTLVLENK